MLTWQGAPTIPSRVSVSDASRVCSTGSVPVWPLARPLGPQDSRRRRAAVTLGNLSSVLHLDLRSRTRPQTFLIIESAALANSREPTLWPQPPALPACLSGCCSAVHWPQGCLQAPSTPICPGPLSSQAPLPFPNLRVLQGSSVQPSVAHLSPVPSSPAVFGGPHLAESLPPPQRSAATSLGPWGCLEHQLVPRRCPVKTSVNPVGPPWLSCFLSQFQIPFVLLQCWGPSSLSLR